MQKKLEALIEVRKIIALLTVGLFIFLAVAGRLDVGFIMSTIGTIIGFYFGKSTALDKPKE